MADIPFVPKILVFSSERISDPAIDLAGLLKKHYPPSVYNITVPLYQQYKTQVDFTCTKKRY